MADKKKKVNNVPLTGETLFKTQKAWETLLVSCQMLGDIVSRLKWLDGTDHPDCDTACTNGRKLYINPEWFNALSNRSRVFVLAHEATHIVQRAWDRRKNDPRYRKESARWGKALDYAANSILENDQSTKLFLTDELYAFMLLPSKNGYPANKSAETYFDLIGPQKEDEEREEENPDEDNGDDQDDNGDDQGDSNDNDRDDNDGDNRTEQLEEEDLLETVRNGTGRGIADKIRKSVMPASDQNCLHNWRDILRNFLWKQTRAHRSYKRPSRRWNGEGVVLPGRSSRDFPKTALILDYSGSMENYIKACASTITQLIAEVSSGDVYVLACNDHIVKSWHVMRNQKPPSTRELLYYYYGGGTHMMPAIREARKWGAEIILCVSDMNTKKEDLLCPDVNWITSKSDPLANLIAESRGITVPGKIFRVLSVGGNEADIRSCRRMGYKIKDEEEMDKQPVVSVRTTKTKTKGKVR